MKSPPRRRLIFLFSVCVFFLISAYFLTHRQLPIPVCHIIGTNPTSNDFWQFSSRSLCLAGTVCFNKGKSLYHSSAISETTCEINTPSYKRTNRRFPALLNGTHRTCLEFQCHFVHCAHGTGLHRISPRCPQIQKLSRKTAKEATWLEDITVVVPDYAFTRNIYHFANPLADLARTVDNLPSLLKRWGVHNLRDNYGRPLPDEVVRFEKLNILLHVSEDIVKQHPWKRELLEVIIKHRMKALEFNVHYASSIDGPVCVRNAVLLGRRGHYNVWPFPNATDVPLDGSAIPKDAVAFKRAVYEAFDIKARLPSSNTGISEPPPLVVGYAIRNGTADSDGYWKAGSMRKFTDEDEKWFLEMLRNETKAHGAELIIVTPNWGHSLQKQVETMVKVGFTIGIHGANLVNSMFMYPHGALLEILPNGVKERCYVAGANSGLRYFGFETGRQADNIESGCFPLDYWCQVDPRQRRVFLAAGDREKIRNMVQEGILHVQRLRKNFPHGVMSTYHEDNDYFEATLH